MRKIMFIDPSIRDLGWALFGSTRSRAALLDCGYLRTSAVSGDDEVDGDGEDRWIVERLDPMVRRMVSVVVDVERLSGVVVESPEMWGTERGMIAASGGSLIKLAACAWSIRQDLVRMGIGVTMVRPVTWKGTRPKKVTVRRVRRYWDWRGSNGNEADAVGMGDWWFRKKRGYSDLTNMCPRD